MIWILFFSVLFYFCAIVLLCVGHNRVPYFSSEEKGAEIKFSIIIPFRNEAENLPALLQSFQQLKYPPSHFELIFVNDASTDASEDIIMKTLKDTQCTYQILQNTPNQPSPKKTAITKAISVAKHPWIITTDADCSVTENWLKILNNYVIAKAPVCVAMPVAYTVNNTLLQRYQQLDNWSLQAVTVGSFGLGNILLSNGANFAYTKEAFQHVNKFEGNLHIASGDDMFLLEKFKQTFPKQIGYLKSRSAVVTTKPVKTWKQVILQRVRWASKTSKQKSIASKVLGLLVFGMNGLFVVTPLIIHFWPQQAIFIVATVLFKIGVDSVLLGKSVQFFKKQIPLFSFLASIFIYPVITVIVVFSSFSGTYIWKERSFKKQQSQ